MPKTPHRVALALAIVLNACSGPAPATRSDGNMTSAGSVENAAVPPPVPARVSTPDPVPAPAPSGTDTGYTGRWIGVEGMYLDVKPAGAPGRYRLEMQWDLDNKGVFAGTAQGDVIVFDRNGVRETLRPTDGDATGLKYLASRSTCLTVRRGEGYCRDR